MIAIEAGVDLAFRVVADFRSLDPADFGGHPGLKLPALVMGEQRVFGAVTICRRIAERAPGDFQIVWPEAMEPDLQTAWELLAHAMAAQVQLVFGVSVNGMPADHPYFVKAARGLEGSIAWLEERWPHLRAALPAGCLSLFEVALFCQLEHLSFRQTAPLKATPNLQDFREAFGARASALATPYRTDSPGESQT